MGTWILLPTLLLQFALCASPILPLSAAIVCTLCVFVCGVTAAYFAYKVCLIDPIDEKLRLHLQDNEGSGESRPNGRPAENEEKGTKFCWIDGIDVYSNSMVSLGGHLEVSGFFSLPIAFPIVNPSDSIALPACPRLALQVLQQGMTNID